jgi:hypothetical protein
MNLKQHLSSIETRKEAAQWFGVRPSKSAKNVIQLWSDDSSVESFANIVKAVRSLLALSLVSEIPLRGVISIGQLPPGMNQRPPQTHDLQESLIGKSLTEAEKKQEWCGCEVTETAIEHYKNTCPAGKSLIDSKKIVPYPIPKKDGDVNGYAVDWVNNDYAGVDSHMIHDAFAPARGPDWKKFKEDEWPKVERKMHNTVKFVEHMSRA